MSKHTPAPWLVHHETHPLGGLKVSITAGRGTIAEILWPNEAANAHLIAAAPVLLQTLREFVAAYNDAMPVKYAEDADYMLARMRDIKDLATRAINEATGAVEGVGEDE